MCSRSFKTQRHTSKYIRNTKFNDIVENSDILPEIKLEGTQPSRV